MNVTNLITTDTCVGCGMCVAVCPKGHLEIGYNACGQLAVTETAAPCLEKCNICLSVCPSSNQAPSEDVHAERLFKNHSQMKYDPACGYYLNSYVGWNPDDEKRMQCASGGVTTYLLATLLEQKKIDTAVVVGRNTQKPFYSFRTCHNTAEVYENSRSSYYAVHADEVMKQIMQDETIKEAAVVALPCLCKAIRSACVKNSVLRKKIKYVIGLVCGQQKGHNFATYLAAKNNVVGLGGLDFRTKKEGRPNGNYGVKLRNSSKHKARITECEITFASYAKEWSFRLFSLPACNFCDDAFAETADVVLMDAWLPEFGGSDKGENLLLVRSAELEVLLGEIPTLKPIDISKVLQSQQSVLQSKRVNIVEHLAQLEKVASYVPQKRTHLFQPPRLLQRPLLRLKYNFSMHTDEWWMKAHEDFGTFCRQMEKYKTKAFIGLALNKIDMLLHR